MLPHWMLAPVSCLPTHESLLQDGRGVRKASGYTASWHLFTHSFIRHVLNDYYVLGSLLCPGLTAVNKTGQILTFVELIFQRVWARWARNKPENLWDVKAVKGDKKLECKRV